MRCQHLVTLTTLLVIAGQYGGWALLARDKVADAERYLSNYIEDLEYIERKEEEELDRVAHSSNGAPAADDDDAWIAVCGAAVDSNLVLTSGSDFQTNVEENLLEWNRCLGKWLSLVSYASWDYDTNITDSNAKKVSDRQVQMAAWEKKLAFSAALYLNSNSYGNLDSDLKRQIRLLAKSSEPSDPKDVRSLADVLNELQSIYSQASVGGQKLEPGLTKIMAESRNGSQLLHVWKEWRHETGPPMKSKYEELVALLNKAARDNNYDNYASLWMDDQFDQTPDLESIAEDLWKELEPLYKQLHAYVRYRLSEVYPEYRNVFSHGEIPAHILGNMMAQEWSAIYDLVKPFPDVPEPDYNHELLSQGYTVNKLFSTAEEFYTSIGLSKMTSKFNKYSMKVRPDGREVVCHASASDFYTKNDFRIKMCTVVNMDYFDTIHHEMGHIEYFMLYANLPTIYRNSANSAFHEAIGDTISLSVMSRSHMQTLGLAGQETDPGTESRMSDSDLRKQDINFQMKRALLKVAFLPFGYMIDKWRWDVFKGKVNSDQYNAHWWKLRSKYQGLAPPVTRTENDFDPGSKFHIPSNSPYICYFFSFISQFQFYEAMCNASGHEGELYNCDFYRSPEAGNKLKSMLQLGKSLPWPDAMEVLTGSREFSTSSILRYFKPLQIWLEKENARNGEVPFGSKQKTKMNNPRPNHGSLNKNLLKRILEDFNLEK